jgi:hypothetical protein
MDAGGTQMKYFKMTSACVRVNVLERVKSVKSVDR